MKKHVLLCIVVLGLSLIFASCTGAGGTTEQTSSPTVQIVTPTPQPTAFEFPDIPPAPEGVSGKDSLADLMRYLDGASGKIETKDFLIREGLRGADDPRIHFEVTFKGAW